MKNLYLLFLALLTCIVVFGQRLSTSYTYPQYLSFSGSTRTSDTTQYQQFTDNTWTFTVHQALSGGFIFGNNNFGDMQKAQGVMAGDMLHPGTDHRVKGVGFLTIKAGGGQAGSKISINIYRINSTSGLPADVLASEDVEFSDIKHGSFTWVSFQDTVEFYGDESYAVGVDLSNLSVDDSVAVLTSADKEYSLPYITYEQWEDGSWHIIKNSWDKDFAAHTKIAYESIYMARIAKSTPDACEGEEVTFSNSSSDAASDFYWNFGPGATPPDATTEGPHKVIFSGNGNKTISFRISDGVKTHTRNELFLIHELPAKPVISQKDHQITTSGTGTFQWSYNGSPISGGTLRTFTPDKNGTYSVVLTDANGCSSTSDNYEVTGLNIQKFTPENLKIYPNPAKDFIKIEGLEGNTRISVYNVLGESVYNGNAENGTKTIHLQHLQPGVYFVSLTTGEHKTTRKIFVN